MSISITAVQGIPEIVAGDRLGAILLGANADLRSGDVVVVASKVVAKAEGRVVTLDTPDSWQALVKSEATRVLRRRDQLLITETHHGFVCANSGIDRSNTEPGTAVLLPKDPDNSAHILRNEIAGLTGVDVAVIINDTNGRAWRQGVVDVAIGCAGIKPVLDLRNTLDGNGNRLTVTQRCIADEIAAAGSLAIGKASRTPFAIVRGVDNEVFGEGSIKHDVIRNYNEDLFR